MVGSFAAMKSKPLLGNNDSSRPETDNEKEWKRQKNRWKPLKTLKRLLHLQPFNWWGVSTLWTFLWPQVPFGDVSWMPSGTTSYTGFTLQPTSYRGPTYFDTWYVPYIAFVHRTSRTRFKMMIYPEMVNEGKGGSCFRTVTKCVTWRRPW